MVTVTKTNTLEPICYDTLMFLLKKKKTHNLEEQIKHCYFEINMAI